MMWIGTTAALVVLWLLGALTLEVTGVRGPRGTGGVVADVAAGAAVLAALGTMMIVAGLRLSLVPFYLLIIGLAIVAAWRRRRIRIAPGWPEDRIAALVLTGACALVAIFVLASLQDRLWWDGWAIWAFKARVLFLDGTLPRSFLDPEGSYVFTHLDYPLAVPLVDWWIYRHAGGAAPVLASFAGAVWFALLPLLLWEGLRESVGDRVAALAALGMAGFWPTAFYATGGAADIVIALALLGAVVERGLGRGDAKALWRCSAYLSLGALAKNEGLAIACMAALVGGITLWRTGVRRPMRFLPLILPFLVLAPWRILCWHLGLGESIILLPGSAAVVGARLPLLVGGFGDIVTTGPWLPLPALAALGVAATVLRRCAECAVAWAVCGGYFLVICAVYLFTPQDLPWLLMTSAPRVLGVFAPTLVYLALRSVAGREVESGNPAAREEIRDATFV